MTAGEPCPAATGRRRKCRTRPQFESRATRRSKAPLDRQKTLDLEHPENALPSKPFLHDLWHGHSA